VLLVLFVVVVLMCPLTHCSVLHITTSFLGRGNGKHYFSQTNQNKTFTLFFFDGFRIVTVVLVFSLCLVPSLAQVSDLAPFREVAPATLGCLFLASFIPFIIFMGRRQGVYMLPDYNPGELEVFLTRTGLMVTTILLMITGFFHFFGTEWLVGFQTVFFAGVGFYGVWLMDVDHLSLYGLLSAFNWLCVIGRLALLGYVQPLTELEPTSCLQYFGYTYQSHRCSTSFIDFLRLLGLVITFFQAIAVYLSYRAYHLALLRGPASRYESIKDVGPDPRLVQPYQSSAMNFGGIATTPYAEDDMETSHP